MSEECTRSKRSSYVGVSRAPMPVLAMIGVIVAAYLLLLAVDDELVYELGREDAPIETVGAMSFLIAAVVFWIVAARRAFDDPVRAGGRLSHTVTFAAMGLLMLICFGEEISWGQRLFGWETPAVFADLNAQNETNLHNLQPVHQFRPDGTEKGFVGKLINMNRLFSVFWLTMFVLLPLAIRCLPRVRGWVGRTGLPEPPLWAGILFLTSFAVYKPLASLYAETVAAHPLDELKETSYAVIYAVLAVAALASDLRRGRE